MSFSSTWQQKVNVYSRKKPLKPFFRFRFSPDNDGQISKYIDDILGNVLIALVVWLYSMCKNAHRLISLHQLIEWCSKYENQILYSNLWQTLRSYSILLISIANKHTWITFLRQMVITPGEIGAYDNCEESKRHHTNIYSNK